MENQRLNEAIKLLTMALEMKKNEWSFKQRNELISYALDDLKTLKQQGRVRERKKKINA